MTSDEAQRVIEALLVAAERPLSIDDLRGVLDAVDEASIRRYIETLRESYRATQRAFTIEEVAGGFQLATEPQFAPWLRKLYKEDRGDRLSTAALETLAIIAYRQPITRVEIEQIRGVNVDGVIGTLLEKGVSKMLGRKEVPGRPLIYGTTTVFLQYFGLNTLSDLPSLEEFIQHPPATPLPEPGAGLTGETAVPPSVATAEMSSADAPVDVVNTIQPPSA